MNLDFYRTKLEEAGIRFAPGLTETEAKRAEDHYAFRFPSDLREFLMSGLPISKGWPNWREVTNPDIARIMNWPFEGMCFDISNNVFWLDEWGEKPSTDEEAFAAAKTQLDLAPTLIPVYGHRYMPAAPDLAGNPVFSVYQTDIIYYGADLGNYLENEFYYYFKTPQYFIKEPVRRIDFWSHLVDRNCGYE
jgi:hypothetical protein